MNTWKVILATVVIFVAGALTGGILVRNYASPPASTLKVAENGHSSLSQSTNSSREVKLPAPMMGPFRKDFLDRLQKELNINAVQRERIEKTLCEGQELTRNIWLEIEPDIYQTIVDTKEKIRADLSAEQNAKFEELFKPKLHSPATNAPALAVTNSAPVKL